MTGLRSMDPTAEVRALPGSFASFGDLPAKDEGFLYWNVERYGFGFKPLLNLMEVAIYSGRRRHSGGQRQIAFRTVTVMSSACSASPAKASAAAMSR